ncbi:MAG TPA: translesion DNA synthesis-associated protein ImuA [Burkholderiaceae bacterium]|nr:translesion DNA synthesis-associated protein ImuA [Burkholderiaceae bacterium]
MSTVEAIPLFTPGRSRLDDAIAPDPAMAADSQRAVALDQLANLWRAGDLQHDDPSASCRPTGFAALDAELPGGGWPTGQLIELLVATPGVGELGLLVPALAGIAQQRRSCVWVLPPERAGNEAVPYPPALANAGIDLARSLFVRPAVARETLWALEQALRATHLGAVIGWMATGTPDGDFRALRRLQLLAGRSRALVFVLRDMSCAPAPSPAALRLQLGATDGCLQVALLKRRGRPLLKPIALQVQPRHWRDARIETLPAAPRRAAAGAAPADDAPAAAPSALSPMTSSPAGRRWSLASIFSH